MAGKFLNYDAPGVPARLIKEREKALSDTSVASTVREILDAVSKLGDKAVLRYTEKFDRAQLKASELRVDPAEIKAAPKTLTPARRKAIRESIAGVSDFHRRTLPKAWRAKNRHGATVGEEFYPIERAGLYIPGGQVPLVSTVIMSAIPAKLAGVPNMVVCTPPQADGSVNPGLLAALHYCGVKEVYKVGGVQAMAAMAFGTKTIPRVDKVYGPGNAYVMEAKRQLFGQVGVDLLPGPSEILVVADASANPAFIASDLLAQAEHGTGKEKVYLVSTSEKVINAVETEMKKQVVSLSHAEKIKAVLKKHYTAVKVSSLEQAAEAANLIAPEHLELQVEKGKERKLIRSITTAGAMLLGGYTPTVLGDFVAGPSHTLPTDRTGRFFSGLQVWDFMRRTSIVCYDQRSGAKAWPTVEAFGEMEQLDAHSRSLKIRLES
ncbi:histidinol dehydrogenase [Ruficoccus amylovorans]|uniref:Histidinol dehydrogenase n=1 Tax=Ruficoccus amylovorans TaxID=1804625 RepID=A0A842HCM1_9BACT|nr:histidinol dehydrogenase [Ruficoccus amylovorans]MBC2593294.1 histidinol dehydrogenase [Ruficoccus amylovorans]